MEVWEHRFNKSCSTYFFVVAGSRCALRLFAERAGVSRTLFQCNLLQAYRARPRNPKSSAAWEELLASRREAIGDMGGETTGDATLAFL